MKIVMVYILRNYKLSTDLKHEDLKIKCALTIRITNGHLVKLEKRTPENIKTISNV